MSRKNQVGQAGDGPRPGYWFVPKLYGFGASPATWQGWLSIAIFVAATVAIVKLVPSDAIRFGLIVPLLIGFCVLCAVKTDGGLSWHWGNRDR